MLFLTPITAALIIASILIFLALRGINDRALLALIALVLILSFFVT